MKPSLIEFGDCRETMRRWATDGRRARTCVTSPPYWGLRDYGHAGQLGLEPTPEEYVANMVEVFRCVRDLLTDDGTLWLNLGDSYANDTKWGGSSGNKNYTSAAGGCMGQRTKRTGKDIDPKRGERGDGQPLKHAGGSGLRPKSLVGCPWRVALALQADGWILRNDLIWHKPNALPEPVKDRCTKAHEYVFLFAKNERYYFDHDSMQEPAVSTHPAGNKTHKYADAYEAGDSEEHRTKAGLKDLAGVVWKTRNRRTLWPGWEDEFEQFLRWKAEQDRDASSVWSIPTNSYRGAHFATFPPDLIEPCILAGSQKGDTVLDPFMGSGTTAAVATLHGREYLGCELNPEYGPLQQERIAIAIRDSRQQSLFV